VKIEAGKVTETVHLINWNEPEKNDFAIAEEVTLEGDHERRPDIVQFIFAGNDSEGLQYGTIGTEEKYFLKWKEDEEDDSGGG
jgi:type I restriction enzyme, R subunit